MNTTISHHLSTYELDAETKKYLSLILFSQVKNTTNLRQMLMNGKLQCCLMKPELIYEPFQVIVATNKALTNDKYGKRITKSIYTEILYNLSISKNISQSLINFGIADNDTDILMAVVHEEEEDLISPVLNHIIGRAIPIEHLNNIRDVTKIKKLYKIDDAELKVSRMLDCIVSRICVKDFITMK